MEDSAIAALEVAAEHYADIRDRRMKLTEEEHDLKGEVLTLMRQHHKTSYAHAGVLITVVPGEDDVKVRVRKVEHEDVVDEVA